MTNKLEAALAYAKLGWRVLPVKTGDKAPLLAQWPTNATSDETVVKKWWRKWPDANIGIVADSAVIVDIDPGARWPADDAQRASIKATQCPVARTPRGGWHLFFKQPPGRQYGPTTKKLAHSVDTRAGAGYVVAAPSRTRAGHYKWLRPLVEPGKLPAPPAWLICQLDGIDDRPLHLGTLVQARVDELLCWPEGVRNCNLFKLGCRLRRAGLGDTEIEAALLQANRTRCCPPLPENEVIRIACSVSKYPVGCELPYGLKRAWTCQIARRRRRKTSEQG